ncbi:hypothetical protein GCM10020254_72250 [Streptomyces goshikiensis]
MGRWQRALCDLAVHHLDDLGEHLGRLKEGLPPAPDLVTFPGQAETGPVPAPEDRQTRVGSAEWNLLTDEVTWSEELFQIFGRSPESGALPLDELGSTLFSEDQPLLTAMVTACLVDGRPPGRRVPHRPGRRPGPHPAHAGRTRPRRRRLHGLHVGRAPRRQRPAAQ